MKGLVKVAIGNSTLVGYSNNEFNGRVFCTHAISPEGLNVILKAEKFNAPEGILSNAAMRIPVTITVTENRKFLEVEGMGMLKTIEVENVMSLSHIMDDAMPYVESLLDGKDVDMEGLSPDEMSTVAFNKIGDAFDMDEPTRARMVAEHRENNPEMFK